MALVACNVQCRGRVRTYAGSEMLGTAIYNLELVTQQLLDGQRISSVQLSMADDWALVFSRDHVAWRGADGRENGGTCTLA